MKMYAIVQDKSDMYFKRLENIYQASIFIFQKYYQIW
jgi:hypothetical protein